MFSLWARFTCAGVFAFACMAARATDFTEPRGPLTLSTALNAALQRNHLLRNADFQLRIVDAQLTQAGLRPNPELGIQLENFGGSGAVRGTSALESTLSLSQVIELGGKRQARVQAARYGIDNATIEREAAQLDVLAEVTRRFIDVAEAQEQLYVARGNAALAQKTFAAIKLRVDAARSPVGEQSRAAIARGRAQLIEQQAESALRTAHRRLAAQWGSSAPQFGDAQTDWFDLPRTESFAALVARLKTTPSFLRFTSEARLRDAQWQLAIAQAKSDVTVGAGIRRFDETGDTGFVVNFSMPIPLANRNQGAIREAALRREQVAVDEDAAFITTQANLFEFYQTLEGSRAEVLRLRDDLIPQADAAVKQLRDGYERGRFSYLELAEAQRELMELQRAAVAAAATFHRALAEIERLTNTPLIASKDPQ